MKIKKGDNVQIISGKDKGKTGKVIKVFIEENRVLVEGVNMRKKHKRSKRQDKKGEIVNLPVPIHVSNTMIVCGKCGKPTRVGYKINDSGQKIRVCKKCGGDT